MLLSAQKANQWVFIKRHKPKGLYVLMRLRPLT